MSTDIKFSKTKISKIVQSGEFFGSWSANLGKNAPKRVGIHLAKHNLPGLVSNLISNAINNFERKVSGKGAVRARRGFILLILNENMDDIIKIIKSLEDSRVLIHGFTESVKNEGKNKKEDFFELC